jgi:hypothetical protein
MAKGGFRVGAGRKPGIPNKKHANAEEAAKGGEMPVEYMLRIMRDPACAITRRDDMAKSAAPYFHPKLSTVEVGGIPGGEPVRFIIEGLTPEPASAAK